METFIEYCIGAIYCLFKGQHVFRDWWCENCGRSIYPQSRRRHFPN